MQAGRCGDGGAEEKGSIGLWVLEMRSVGPGDRARLVLCGGLIKKMKSSNKSEMIRLWICLVGAEVVVFSCGKEEREALLSLNSGLRFPFSWEWEGTDCCQWKRVECNATTGRVAKLDLSCWYCGSTAYEMDPYFSGYLNSDFAVFKDLKSLNLSNSMIVGCADNDEGLKNLEVLDLSYNDLNNGAKILSCLDGLSSLKSLYLAFNSLDASSLHDFETLSSKVRNLEVLDISYNPLTNEILPFIGRFSSLKELYLARTKLDSDLHIQGLSSTLMNLEVLDLSENNFNDSDIAYALSGLSSLKSLSLEDIQLTRKSIFSISKLSSLEILDLARNQLNESILWRLGNDGFTWPTGLQVLRLNGNRFLNKVFSSLTGLPSLKSLDLSNNQLEGALDISGLSILTSLKILDLRFNQINNFVVHRGLQSISTLDVLALDGNAIDGKKLSKSLPTLPSLKVLSLTQIPFKGAIIARDFRDLKNLERLVLDGSSNLESEFFESIGDLTSLKVLSLSECDINGTLPAADWFKLKKLEELNLIFNKFEGPLPATFVNMTSLRILELSQNNFIGNFASNLASLTSLVYFGFKENQFEVPISFAPFANHSNLKFIYGEGNKVIMDSQPFLQTWIPKFQLQVLSLSSTTEANSIPFPNFLLYQYNITSLDFTSCLLEGEFPHWLLENNTQLTEILLRNCSFTGNFQLPSRPLPKIRKIDVSDNIITGQLFSSNISSIFPNLQFLNMSINDIQGSIPHEFSQMHLLDTLDLSYNNLSGEIPKNISGYRSQLKYLKLSNNKLHGPVFPTLSSLKNLEEVYFDGNSLSGSIYRFSAASLMALDISNNHLVGKLPSVIGNLSKLVVLSLSNNDLGGPISTRFVELEDLAYLDISQNNFSGLLPSFANPFLRFIHMSNNMFTGLSKSTFNSSSLVILDLSYNKITSNIQDTILELEKSPLHILILKGNHFSGHIPQQLCQLKELFILDLSCNNFSGLVPNCLGKMPFEIDNSAALGIDGVLPATGYSRWGKSFPIAKAKVNFTTKKRSYTYKGYILAYMSGIDLSNNKLNGNIPSEFGKLTRIRTLNLSHNDFNGQIPASFSNLVQIESLDLSSNKLTGQIPPQLSELSFLAVFSVAHNNLSGETPERKGQFITFDESSYEGNPFLCGPPLPKSCNPDYRQPHVIPSNTSYTDGENCSFVDMFAFWICFGVSYTSVLLVIAATLYINPYWRRTWFYYIELVCTNCYYFLEDHILLKFSNCTTS
ncbi:unnamed protein product [Sphenostylis stenocarpa]|uniref:Leucine-rich repeat-containing N-terminal plant-type domain-containing protein n=1 Tax=Sphenostylis stenocarpa TaxID=92480 RepID=A0AA86RVL0_9FABA|nr:unnamed protein product [Sphenostylis stenocarpa]